MHFAGRFQRMPKAFHHSAQGCRVLAATLGPKDTRPTLKELNQVFAAPAALQQNRTQSHP